MALTKKLDAIGAAIREKTGDTNKYTLDEMVTAIGTISGGGGGSAAGLIDGTTTVLKDGDAKAVNMAFINSNLTEINLPKAESVDFVNNNTSWGIKCYVNNSTYNCGAFGANSKLAKVSMPKCKKVGDYTFIGCTALTDVDLSACTSIGQYAFYYCIGLKTLDKLGACLTVDKDAFAQCKNLVSISLPACTNIGYEAFDNCTKLKDIALPSATTLGQYAFYGCTSLASVELPACTSLGYQAFQKCSSLASVELPACTSLEGSAFSSCSSLASVELPNCVTLSSAGIYKDGTFAYCKKLQKINLSSCTKICGDTYQGFNGAFYNCESLESIDLPVCESVPMFLFYNCYNLTKVDFGAITESLPQQIFMNDYSLTAVIIRTTYKVIGLSSTDAFTNCYHFYGTVNATYNPDGAKDGYIYVPDTLVDSYKTATNWATLADQIKPLSELPTA